MNPRIGRTVLGLSAAGYPLTQFAIRRLGRRGAMITETACVGLAIRDAAMIASGVPTRLRKGPAALLWLELAAATTAAGLGLPLAVDRDAALKSTDARSGALEMARRSAVVILFGLHMVRFWIYLQPDQGRRHPSPLPSDA